ncbi:MAG: phage tail sheath subtilisin-like domain-containing protein [Pseudomonadota bacterium]
MPEYLAPGVYIEEVPSGSKPIQGASTSTAGMVGVTARGPVNTPTLVTSLGNYARVFGGKLNGALYTNGRDALPYAAEGFFANGGSRLYVSRIVGEAAAAASLTLSGLSGKAVARLFSETASGADAALRMSNAKELAANDTLLLAGRNGAETVTVSAAPTDASLRVSVTEALTDDLPGTTKVETFELLETVIVKNTDIASNDKEIELETAPVTSPTHILDGDLKTGKILSIDTFSNAMLTMDDALTEDLESGSEVTLLKLSGDTTLGAPHTGAPGTAHLPMTDATGIADGQILVLTNGTDVTRRMVSAVTHEVIVTQLNATIEDGAAAYPSVSVATLHARSEGAWGDNLRATALPAAMLSTKTDTVTLNGSKTLSVESAVGVYVGSYVSIDGAAAVEVEAVDAGDGIITLKDAVSKEIAIGSSVTSQEFSLRVELLDGDGQREEEEFFENLSLSATHPRFAPAIIGSWSQGPSDAGSSSLIRMEIPVNVTTRDKPLISGVAQMLDGGGDDLSTIDDGAYIGEPSEDPGDRTGIWALENEPTLSIVAVPGQTSVAVQKALVAHCEKMRYRFAVLDTPLGSNLAAARTHRQNFDSTRCAIYYPGLSIADPFGGNGALRTITPSGHMMGLYARTDNTRGVHKAPANEVVRNIMGFETKLTKGEQDILNPINLNCMRDFRSENRGLRCYGARVATSDPEWKYINVRRLLLYIEQSLDVGLQWAVFEPNDTPLWDTVRQSCTNFLNTTWRSGALQGTTQEQAFFVDIGLGTTMTQDDIDNGRMIVRIGVAPVKPAEFVIARISQKTLEAAG